MRAAIFLPTLNRVALVKNFIQSYNKTKTKIPLWIVTDHTDPSLNEYTKLELPDGAKLIITHAVSMGDKARELWPELKALDALVILNDDHECVTENWDDKVLSKITGTNVVCTNDGYVAPNRICGAICFSGKVLRTLDYLFLPGMHHLFSDDVWNVLFAQAGCCQILMDVMVKHNHAYQDQSRIDDTYVKVNGPKGLINGQGVGGFWPNDKKVFEEWMKDGMGKDLKKIVSLQPKTGLFLAVPSQHGDVAIDWSTGLLGLGTFFQQHGVYFELGRVTGSSLLPHARNNLVEMFLESRCQKLLFIDSDQGWTREAALALFQSNKKIVAGVVPHKRWPINLNFEPLADDMKYFKSPTNKAPEEFWTYAKEKASVNGEIEVARVGTGIVCIDRSVFDILKEDMDIYYPFDFNTDVEHREWFKMGVGDNKHYNGEDWWFCQAVKKQGIPLFINANSLCTHKGAYTWTISGPTT